MFASKETRGFYAAEIHGNNMPADVVEISAELHASLLAGQSQGQVIDWDAAGYPFLNTPPPAAITAASLCAEIDDAADIARRKVAGDPLRAVEYDRARVAAEAFAADGFQGEVPAMVAAWVTSARTPQQAAENILAEAALYTHALELLRTTRLQAKEMIRALMANGEVGQAQDVADETIAAIEAAVAGIGNNAS